MTRTDEVKKGGDDGEITVNAVPADSSGAPFVMASPPTYNNGAAPGEPPIPYGHRRFYCSTCRTVRVKNCYSNIIICHG